MTKYFKSYRRFFKKALNDDSTDLSQLMNYHKDHIHFFQHERFIHLIVMFLFAIATVITFIVIAVTKEILLIPLAAALLVLLVPYIKHYYFLENQTQALYHDYEKLHEKLYGFPADEDELK
ncbi:MAG: hypothetical protein IJ571_03685 [Ruminococcus sp.]|nr:hypothetical protein [Ruminococcus sp.]